MSAAARGGHRVGVKKLAGNQRQAQHNAKALRGAHLFGNGPADANRQHMEDSLANQPKEAVNTGPELTDITKRLCAVAKQINTVNTVAEAQNQTAGDDGGNQRGKDFSQHAHNSLQCVLILLGRALDGVFGNTINAGYRDKIIVKIVDRVSDNHLKLPACVNVPLADFRDSILATSALAGSFRTKRIRDTQ